MFSVHIARMTENVDAGAVNTYTALVKMDPWQESRIGDTEWTLDGVEFEHRAGDGIETLVRRALVALDKPDEEE